MNLNKALARDTNGAAALEFALIAPVIIGMLLGIFQIGMGMNNYNSLRGAADDAARFAVVEYQKGVRPTEQVLETRVRAIATASPYNLGGGQERLTVDVDILGTSRVAGALEATITLEYDVPTVMAIFDMNDIPIRYTRSVFLLS